jgi:hypothetical protein
MKVKEATLLAKIAEGHERHAALQDQLACMRAELAAANAANASYKTGMADRVANLESELQTERARLAQLHADSGCVQLERASLTQSALALAGDHKKTIAVLHSRHGEERARMQGAIRAAAQRVEVLERDRRERERLNAAAEASHVVMAARLKGELARNEDEARRLRALLSAREATDAAKDRESACRQDTLVVEISTLRNILQQPRAGSADKGAHEGSSTDGSDLAAAYKARLDALQALLDGERARAQDELEAERARLQGELAAANSSLEEAIAASNVAHTHADAALQEEARASQARAQASEEELAALRAVLETRNNSAQGSSSTTASSSSSSAAAAAAAVVAVEEHRSSSEADLSAAHEKKVGAILESFDQERASMAAELAAVTAKVEQLGREEGVLAQAATTAEELRSAEVERLHAAVKESMEAVRCLQEELACKEAGGYDKGEGEGRVATGSGRKRENTCVCVCVFGGGGGSEREERERER